jgi:hypothetical protein
MFAGTGGDGVHFNFLVPDGWIRENPPVIVTIPDMGGLNFVVGDNLHDFLCLGAYRGYFALAELAYNLDLTLEVFTNRDWQSSERSHESVGYTLDEEQKTVLEFLTNELGLRPWSDPRHFWDLQQRYGGLL